MTTYLEGYGDCQQDLKATLYEFHMNMLAEFYMYMLLGVLFFLLSILIEIYYLEKRQEIFEKRQEYLTPVYHAV